MFRIFTPKPWIPFTVGLALLSLAAGQPIPANSGTASGPSTPQEIVKSVTLTHLANQKEYGELFILFREAGINVTNNSKIKKKRNWLKEIKFQLTHPRGLNFRLRVTGFRKLQFRFVYDAQKQFQYFTFRINDEEVYQHIEPDTKGYKTYVCFDTGIVQEGNTNNRIERYH